MLETTRGIILHTMPYNDKYVIIHAYTEIAGRISYLVASNRGRKSKVSRSLFMPLSVLEMVVDHQQKRDLQRIKETRISEPLHYIATHPVKNTVALFIAEVIYRAVRTKETDVRLFNFLLESIRWLNHTGQGISNFHLVFLIQLVRYLGVNPNGENYLAGNCYFDLLNGVFTILPPEHKYYLNKSESIVFWRLLRMNYENMAVYTFSRQERSSIIQRILEYYRLHLPEFPEIKSLAVMQQLYD